MNRSAYQVKVTELLDAAFGQDSSFEYPDSFESDVDNCFGRHLSAEDAAQELLRDYAPDLADDYAANAANTEIAREESIDETEGQES